MVSYLLCAARVGKTSITLRYTTNHFDEESPSTIDATCLEKSLTINHQTYKLSIWDTAGQQKYNALVPMYYRDADGALIVYDITSAQSFTKVKKWISELNKYSKQGTIIAVVGNKKDLDFMRAVPYEDGQSLAQAQNLLFFQVSAKKNTNIQAMFQKMLHAIVQKKNSKTQTPEKSWRQTGLLNLTEQAAQKKPTKRQRCCRSSSS